MINYDVPPIRLFDQWLGADCAEEQARLLRRLRKELKELP